jgi:hypothetical protein
MFSFVLSLFVDHPTIFLGYAIAVLFPVPWLSSLIISVWASVGSKLVAKVKSYLPS